MIIPGFVWVGVAMVPLQVGFWIYWKRKTRPAIERGLQAWQDRTGYTILERRRCLFDPGPLGLMKSRGQVVYRVTLISPTGERCRAYARVGSYWGGALWRPDVVKVMPDGPDYTPIADPGHG